MERRGDRWSMSMTSVRRLSSLSKRRARPCTTRSSMSVTTEQNYRIREIAAIVGQVFDGCAITFGQPSGDNRSYRTSFDKIRRHLPEFRCRWSAELGARQLHQVFSQIKMTREMFFFRGFTRLEQLKHLIATGQIDADFYWRPLEQQAGEGQAE